jgi:hypothetical protein
MFFSSSLKLKRVNRSKRSTITSPRKEITNNSATPGDLKCRQIYSILDKSLRHDDDELPQGTLASLLPLCKETARIFSHHFFGYDIIYGDHDFSSPKEEWGQVCKWIKLNETACLGGAVGVSRLTVLYSCFRMINLVDTLDEEIHDHVGQTHARAYATAAMQMSLVIPKRSLAEKVSNYFWQHALVHHKDDDDEDTSLWLLALSWMDPDQEYDSITEMRQTRAWSETMEILLNQTPIHPVTASANTATPNLGISYTAPVVVPVAILSTLHLLDSLRIQFDRLISTMTSRDIGFDETLETYFLDIMLMTEPHSESEDDQQRLVHWLAAVGATVEALWKNNNAEKWLPTLIHRVPRSMTCRASSVSQKANLNQLDELMKKAMIHVLVGSALLKQEDSERQKQGLIDLENAEVLRSAIRKLQKSRSATEEQEGDLESVVMALAEFVVSFIGLGSWIDAMRLEDISGDKEILIDEQIREATLSLRRMIRHPALLDNQQSIVDRLSRLGRLISHHPGDADSACDLSDGEYDEDEQECDQEDIDHHQVLIKRADKAQLILHGLA